MAAASAVFVLTWVHPLYILASNDRPKSFNIALYQSTRMRSCGRDDISDAKSKSGYLSNPTK